MSHRLTLSDKILKKIFLPIIPHRITPNMISWTRFATVPFVGYFLWIAEYSIALPLFMVSAFSDAVDGALARTRNLVTPFGKLLDPLADKLLIATTALIIIPRYLDWGIVLAIVLIDIFLILNAYSQKRFYGKIIQAENSGKLKMVAQSFGLIFLLIYAITKISILLTVAQYLFFVGIFFALISLVVYRSA